MRDIDHNYKVDEEGNVYSRTRRNTRGGMMTPTLMTSGYLSVTLHPGNRRVTIHGLVAEAFVPNPDNLPQVNHKDGNKLNNNANNLEWCTRSHNGKHAYDTGLSKQYTGQEHHNSKLTEEAVRFILENYRPRDKKLGARALAQKFNVSTAAISAVVTGRSWNTFINTIKKE